MANQKRTRCAVVGVGHFGRYHVQKHLKSENSTLVCLVDKGPSTFARELAEQAQLPLLIDYKQLLDYHVECISIATPTTSHFNIAAWALQNGLDVLVEKPVCDSAERAAKLLQIAEQQQRILQCEVVRYSWFQSRNYSREYPAGNSRIKRAGFPA